MLDANSEAEEWKSKYKVVAELESRIRLLVTENERLTQVISDLRRDNETFRLKIVEIDKRANQIIELENKIRMLVNENDRINGLLEAKT